MFFRDKKEQGGDKMAIGFVLIGCAPMHEHEVYNKLQKTEEIIEVHPLFGKYDLIVKIESDDFNNIGKIVVEKIRSIEGIIDTKTLTGTRF